MNQNTSPLIVTTKKLIPWMKGIGEETESKSPERFIIPEIYQRRYSWAENDWRALWESILGLIPSALDSIKKKELTKVEPHFMGSILCHKSGNDQVIIADGQQRLVTISIMLRAMLDYVITNHPTVKVNQHLFKSAIVQWDRNNLEQTVVYSDKVTTLKVGHFDREEYENLILNGKITKPIGVEAHKLSEAYLFFTREMVAYFENSLEDPEHIIKAFNSVNDSLVCTEIQADVSSLQGIFETVNSLGVELELGELLKNFITMGLSLQDGTDLYTDYYLFLDRDAYTSTADNKNRLSDLIYAWLSGNIRDDKKLFSSLRKDKNTQYIVIKNLLNKKSLSPSNKINAYKDFSKELVLSIQLWEALEKLEEIDALQDDKGWEAYYKSLLDNKTDDFYLIKEEHNAERMNYIFFKTLFYNYKLLGVFGRKSIVFQLIKYRSIFIDINKNGKNGSGLFFDSIERIITTYAVRSQVFKDDFGGTEEGYLMNAIEKAYLDSFNQFAIKSPAFRESFKNILIAEVEKVGTHNEKYKEKNAFMIKTPTEFKKKMADYPFGEGKVRIALGRYLLARYTDNSILTKKLKNGKISDPTTGVKLWVTYKSDKKATLEHFYPRNPITDASWPEMEKVNSNLVNLYTNIIGNLTLLNSNDQALVSNFGLVYKFSKLGDGILAQTILRRSIEHHIPELTHDEISKLKDLNSINDEEEIQKTLTNDKIQWGPIQITNRGEELIKVIVEDIITY